MEMTIDEVLTNLECLQKDYQDFHDDVWQDIESYGVIAESLRIGIDTMRKYQKIEQIIRNYDVAWEFHNMRDTIDKIREVIEDGERCKI